MKKLNIWVLSFVLFASAALCSMEVATAAIAQDAPATAQEDDQPLIEPPDQPQDRPPPPAEGERPRRLREPPPGERGSGTPGMREHRGRRGVGMRGSGARAGSRRQPRHFQMMERILPLIAEDHPDLARRLMRIRDTSPEEFERLCADALCIRFEEALQRGEARPPLPGVRPHPPREAAGPEWVDLQLRSDPVTQFFAHKTREFERRNEELERHSTELVHRYNELRQRREPGLHVERDELRRQIEKAVDEHFDVRTELRRFELRRVETELDRLRKMVERVRDDLERREQARGSIIEQRLKQLLGEEGGDW